MFSQWKFIEMEKGEDSCCFNGENKHIEISATKRWGVGGVRESGKQTRHIKYRSIQQKKKQYIQLFSYGLYNIIIMWFISNAGVEIVSG